MMFLRRLAAVVLCLYLGIFNGQLALYEAGTEQPTQILPYKVSTYPKIDQTALKYGIPIKSAEHLKQLLEDFLA